jgi:Helix-turn-helix domain/PIF1-like helicase
MLFDTGNHIFQLASLFVNQTGAPVFLTGKAGTGKTTFLKYIRENCFKKMAVVAPTGVAAINAGGVTLHSFFQLPFGPYIPVSRRGWDQGDNAGDHGDAAQGPGDHRRLHGGHSRDQDDRAPVDQHSLFSNIRFNADKRELLQELELLVIDEVSMVRADMLDAVDAILRHFRQQPLIPFGGVQVLYIGDLFQLPPVVSNEEWEILKDHYASPFFFDAQVLRQSPPFYLELKKIYRQNEADFIDILNNIRNNRPTPEDMERLHRHYQPDFQAAKEKNYITLTSHNAKASAINQSELHGLPGKLYAFEAGLTGEFNDRSFPAEKTLHLKEGAQVMFIKNDKGDTRRYFNGKIGAIKKIAGSEITVTFPGETDGLTVEKETWKNIRYSFNKEKDKIEEEELGSFSQFPLRLAWAITIHKSQGLTFEKAIIDAGASFAPGQVYVALSRLTTIDGLILRSRIYPQSISTDRRVIDFTETALAEGKLRDQLQQEQQSFIRRSLIQSFNWSRLTAAIRELPEEADPPARKKSGGSPHRPATGNNRPSPEKLNFLTLAGQLLQRTVIQEETALKFTRLLEQLLNNAPIDGYHQLQERVEAAAGYFMKVVESELVIPTQEHIAEIRIKQKTKKLVQLLTELKLLFTRKKQQLEQAVQIVSGLTQGVDATDLLSVLHEQQKSNVDPSGLQELKGGGGEPKIGKPKKGDTARISLELFKEGRTIPDIAARRGLAKTTIEGHLAAYIPTGEIDIKELVAEHKMGPILEIIEKSGLSSLTPLKEALGDDYSFAEIRSVLKYMEYKKLREPAS